MSTRYYRFAGWARIAGGAWQRWATGNDAAKVRQRLYRRVLRCPDADQIDTVVLASGLTPQPMMPGKKMPGGSRAWDEDFTIRRIGQ